MRAYKKRGYHGVCIMGPPGSGKSTLADTLAQVVESCGQACLHINLDPAIITPLVDIDIRTLAALDEVQELTGLGPNGGLIYALEFLYMNSDWLLNEIDDAILKRRKDDGFTNDPFLIIDLPGQVECYIAHTGLSHFLEDLVFVQGINLCTLFTLDCRYLLDPRLYLSTSLSVTAQQVSIPTPAIQVLTKSDLLTETEAQELENVLDQDSLEEYMAIQGVDDKFHLNIARVIGNTLSLPPLPISAYHPASLELLLHEIHRLLGV
ncbi:ATP-binding protein [Giardia muris]|uniref:GPN-loop GTPase 2 n=1 Tax=Giardia muris TaxID=5742 RepID=A0A4Z1T5A3_GIAMU|nr:ATP-binding protein [Giardia muris]|eukprot:TNJ28277.1 ATP-binding protein [Giardia muris]